MSGPFVLITGVLFKNSESKIAKSGKPYATANVIVTAGNERTYWRITAFGETAQAELLRLKEGDSLSVQGSLQIELYESRGEQKISRGMIADQILPLKPPPKKSEPKTGNSKHESPYAPLSINDEIPF